MSFLIYHNPFLSQNGRKLLAYMIEHGFQSDFDSDHDAQAYSLFSELLQRGIFQSVQDIEEAMQELFHAEYITHNEESGEILFIY